MAHAPVPQSRPVCRQRIVGEVEAVLGWGVGMAYLRREMSRVHVVEVSGSRTRCVDGDWCEASRVDVCRREQHLPARHRVTQASHREENLALHGGDDEAGEAEDDSDADRRERRGDAANRC